MRRCAKGKLDGNDQPDSRFSVQWREKRQKTSFNTNLKQQQSSESGMQEFAFAKGQGFTVNVKQL